MKNMKKFVSLLLAVCLMASLAIGASAAEPTTVDVSGGTGTSSVSLSSTSDGTLDGDPAATKMNVTIPTIHQHTAFALGVGQLDNGDSQRCFNGGAFLVPLLQRNALIAELPYRDARIVLVAALAE